MTQTKQDIEKGSIARLMAKIHKIDPSWYTPFRECERAKSPIFKDVSDGSYFWLLSTRHRYFGKISTDEKKKWYVNFPLVEPISKAGKRVVTTHGDIHGMN